MTNVGENVILMGGQDYHCYLERCQRLTTLLDQAITFLMHFIFEGRSRDHHEWETLFKAVSQAVLMKYFLSSNHSDLCTISEDFLAQLEDWKQDIEDRHN